MNLFTPHLRAEPEQGSDSGFHTLMRRSDGKHFGHTWRNGPDWGKHAGKWTFNRGSVCIMAEWWPEVYEHDTLEALLAHLENTCPALE